LSEVLTYVVLWIAGIFTVAVLASLIPSKSKCEEKTQELNRRIEELKEKLKEVEEDKERIRQHYEMLLKEAAIKNTIMIALYNAWKDGKLKECYSGGGEVRILADGTLLCHKEKIEESYTIGVEEVEEGAATGRRRAA